MKQYISEYVEKYCKYLRGNVQEFSFPPDEAYAPRFKSSTFMGVVFAETVRDKPV